MMCEEMRGNGSDQPGLRGRLANVETEQLFRRMSEQHAVALRRSALAWGSNSADAADLVQEVFEKALRARPPVRDANELRGWLFIVLRHLYVDKKRSAASRRSIPFDVLVMATPEPEAIPLWRQVDIEVVYALLPRLSLPLRRTFELRMAGNSPRRIARHLEIPEATVGVQLYRARRHLKKLILAQSQCEHTKIEGAQSPDRFVPYVVKPLNDRHQDGSPVPSQSNRKRRLVGARVRNGIERGERSLATVT